MGPAVLLPVTTLPRADDVNELALSEISVLKVELERYANDDDGINPLIDGVIKVVRRCLLRVA